MASLWAIAGLTVVSTAVVWVGSHLLDRSSEQLSQAYGLPPVVEGAIVVAIGSSFPELSATVLSTLLHGEFDLGVGAIVGSAIFNVLVIPAAVALVARPARSNRDLVFKESLFYMLSIAVLVLTFALAVIYEPVEAASLSGRVTRLMALGPLALYALYLFVQQADVSDRGTGRDPSARLWPAWIGLAVSLVLIVGAVEGLLQAALQLSDLLGTPSYVWGLTIVAAATSIPDAFVSIQAARRDRGVQGLANVLGSNVFDLCVAVPAGVLLGGAAVVDFEAAVPMLGVLTASTVLLFAFLRTDLEIEAWEGIVLLAAYAAFLGLALETGGVLDLV